MYIVSENTVFISNANNFKGLDFAKRIATNLKHVFAEEILVSIYRYTSILCILFLKSVQIS